MSEPIWHPSACILCECNCGIEILLGEDDKTFAKIRGDKQHPASRGYTCNKALQLDTYQNGATDRVRTPLRRAADGHFEPIDWNTAIAQISDRLAAIRDEHGGETIFYYGGGGQGNHLGGAYASATMAAYGMRYRSSALAQEKTGEFWVNARMFGSSVRGDFEHCDVAVFIGKNPYQSHGFPRARSVLKEIAKDPKRTMIVIDPVRTDTAELADMHLQVRPGTDIYLLSAIAAVLVQDGLVDKTWIDEHVEGFEAVASVLSDVPVAHYCEVADVDEALVRQVASLIAHADSVAVFEDLGVQMNQHSTVVSYVEKLIWVLTGNFGKPGAQYLPTNLTAIGRDRGKPFDEMPRSPVVGAPIISGLVPCNMIADEILTDHPQRYRAMFVESANPAHSLAGSTRMAQALESLDLLVVVDVAMSETAQLADYVLPAPTQFEKFEATFFNFDFPDNIHHLRHPVLPAPDGVLPEPEIHARLVEACGALDDSDYEPLREAAAEGRAAFAAAFLALVTDPAKRRLAPVILYRTLGPTLPEGAASAAVLWAAAHQMAMTEPHSVGRAGHENGERLFEAILTGTHGVVMTTDTYETSWQRISNARIQVDLPELLAAVAGLDIPAVLPDPEFPFVLSAGERRAFTANTIFRDPSWRKRDRDGALRMSQADAGTLGVRSGDMVRVCTASGSSEVAIEVTDRMRPGHISLPNGMGLSTTAGVVGVAPNKLTSAADRDEWAGTPWHKHVPARVEVLAAGADG